MPKTNCNIIKDLLPSYLDEICSKESRHLIEEHFKECENCQKLYERNKLELLHSGTITSKEIDYFKTIRGNVTKKNAALLFIIGILFLIQLYFNFQIYRFSSGITMYVNYIFPILIAGTLFAILPDYTEQPVSNKIKLPILGIEFAAMTYIFVLLIFVGHHLLNGTIPFGIQTEEIGPFLIIQLLVLCMFFIFTFIASLLLSLRKKAICPAICFVPLGGCSLMFEYRSILHEFDTRFQLSLFIRPYIIILCEIIVLVGLYMFMNRKKMI